MDVLTGKGKAAISVLKKSRIAKLPHTKSACDFDGMNSPSRERIFKYASLVMPTSPTFSNILQLSHFDRLINYLATYPAIVVANSALFSS